MNWKTFFKIIFSLILLTMLSIGILALLKGNWKNAASCIRGNFWLLSTTGDMYVMFFIFSLWIFYKESGWLPKLGWSFLVFLLGAISVSIYLLIQIGNLKQDEGLSELLTKRN